MCETVSKCLLGRFNNSSNFSVVFFNVGTCCHFPSLQKGISAVAGAPRLWFVQISRHVSLTNLPK